MGNRAIARGIYFLRATAPSVGLVVERKFIVDK
jgi:hypothetical protein